MLFCSIWCPIKYASLPLVVHVVLLVSFDRQFFIRQFFVFPIIGRKENFAMKICIFAAVMLSSTLVVGLSIIRPEYLIREEQEVSFRTIQMLGSTNCQMLP